VACVQTEARKCSGMHGSVAPELAISGLLASHSESKRVFDLTGFTAYFQYWMILWRPSGVFYSR